MAKLQYKSISRRTVDALRVEKDTIFWDREMLGFGVRVHPSGKKVYIVQSRSRGESKRVTVGNHGVLSADQARRRAADMIARIKAGKEPVPAPAAILPTGPTVAELADRYLSEYVEIRCKESTAEKYRMLLTNHVLPALGDLPISSLNRKNIAGLHYQLRDRPATANHVVGILSQIFNQADTWGLVSNKANPCRGVPKYKARKHERFLTEEEFRRLGSVLSDAPLRGGISAHAVAAIRLLILTGCRRNEVLTLRWENVDLEARVLRLADSKTGPRMIPLSPAAVRILADLPRTTDSPWVIVGKKAGTHMRNINEPWDIVRKRASLDDVRLHDLRHSWASRALALGESLPMIGRLLGHTQVETTARYAHLARDSIKESAARVAASIGEDLFRCREVGGTKPRHVRL